MQIRFFCPHWGSEHIPFETFLNKVKNAGYSGVEMSLPFDQDNKKYILDQLNESGLSLIAQHWETTDPDYNEHKKNYERRLRNLCDVAPVSVNTQTGKDYFSFEENSGLIELAGKIEDETGVKIVHETHRGKFSFAAHIARKYMEEIPDLRITLDISHWFNVAESNLEDQADALLLAVERTDHIHARVGFNEGPQVSDPAAPEWQEFLDLHLKWWDRVIHHHNHNGAEIVTITPEFGPAPYMPLLPFSSKPVADQWEVNMFMKQLLTKRYRDITTP